MTSSPFLPSRIAQTVRPRRKASEDTTCSFADTPSPVLDVGSVPGVRGGAYLKIEGIPGESERSGRQDSIDVEAIAWGVGSTAIRRARPEVQPQPLELVMRGSAASIRLWDAAANGRRIADAVLTLTRHDDAGQEVDFLIITLEEASVASYRVVTNSASGGHLDVVTLRYGAATYEHADTGASAERDFAGRA